MGHRNGGPKRYGKTEYEREIIDFIVHARKQKKTLKEIVDDLHARAMYPRNAFQWNELLVYHVYKRATEGGIRNG